MDWDLYHPLPSLVREGKPLPPVGPGPVSLWVRLRYQEMDPTDIMGSWVPTSDAPSRDVTLGFRGSIRVEDFVWETELLG